MSTIRAVTGLIHQIVARHRRELLRSERAAAGEMVRAYGAIWRRLRQEIVRLVEQYNAADGDVSESWVARTERMEALQRQTERELRRFAATADELIQAQQREAIEAARRHTQELVAASLNGAEASIGIAWNRLPTGALADLVGATRDGSPLRDLLDELGPAASQTVREGLLEGLALGQNPRVVASRIRDALGGNLSRALRISRTETLRAYRTATWRDYQANSDILAGWRWAAAKSARTCAACLAMDGTFHDLDEHLDDHPNGRCTMIPVLKGHESEHPPGDTGSEWFVKQSEADQRLILGNSGYEAYKGGAVTLQDFVGQRQSRVWGSTRYARSLREILGSDEADRWKAVARTPKWQHWEPNRADAHMAGRCGDQLLGIIGRSAGVRDVYVVPGTTAHYRARHGLEFDIDRAESLVGAIISDPLELYRGTKKNSIVFVGLYDARHYLAVPVKVLQGELWQESLYIDEIERFRARKWVQKGLLYRKR